MLSDEEKKDILFQIDMQLYDEFNDKFCEMNDNLGTFYTYKDIEDLEKLEKETEIILLRQAIEKQSKEIERLNNKFEKIYNEIDNKNSQLVKALNYKLFMKDKIKAKIEELEKECENCEFGKFLCKQCFTEKGISILESLLEKE